MAENSRGQNRNQRKNNGPSTSSQDENRSNKRTAPGGVRDSNLDRVRNDNRTPKTSGLSEKRNFTGNNFDGQLSDE